MLCIIGIVPGEKLIGHFAYNVICACCKVPCDGLCFEEFVTDLELMISSLGSLCRKKLSMLMNQFPADFLTLIFGDSSVF